jgi:uncharacterized membrane protein
MKKRLFAPDALRGLLMVLMALDHANLFIAHKHSSGEMWGGPFPVYTDALPFITRLVTHLAAPGFFLLMGVGMALLAHAHEEQGWTRWQIFRHFWIRGIVLMLLQILVVNRAWELSPGGWGIALYIGVLYALGGTMILGSLCHRLSPRYLLVLAFVLFVGMELLHPGPEMWGHVSQDPANVILIRPGGTSAVWSYYPVLPWLELVIFGMALGKWLIADSEKAFSRIWKLGLAFLAAFVVIRALDSFGNIRPRMGNTWIDFFNPVKYPPSMTFTLMTTGVNLILLWAFSRANERTQRILKPLTVFGRAPLFFYVLHLFLYAGIGRLVAPKGMSIPAMLPFWLLGLAILFPLCLWYGKFKHQQPENSPLRFL